MLRKPCVSIIIPTYNTSPDVLIESLGSIVNQTFNNFECIVIDDSDDIKSVIASKEFCANDSRFKYIHNVKRVGISISRNQGIALSRGEFIAFFDSDDICLENRLEIQVDFLKKNNDVDVLGSWLSIVDGSGEPLAERHYPTTHHEIEKAFLYTTPIAQPVVMLRRSLLVSSHDTYRKSFSYSEDLDLWLRLLNKKARFANIPKILLKYRQEYSGRPAQHWFFNIKARILNLSSPNLYLKIVVIFLLIGWALTPNVVKTPIYKKFAFN